MVLFYFPVFFVVSRGYALISDYLPLGVFNKSGHMKFVYLCEGYLTQYFLFQYYYHGGALGVIESGTEVFPWRGEWRKMWKMVKRIEG